MKSTYNKSEIMSRAWQIRKENNLSMSEALKQSWSEAFFGNMDFDMFDTKLVKPVVKEIKLIDKVFTYDRRVQLEVMRKSLGY